MGILLLQLWVLLYNPADILIVQARETDADIHNRIIRKVFKGPMKLSPIQTIRVVHEEWPPLFSKISDNNSHYNNLLCGRVAGCCKTHGEQWAETCIQPFGAQVE